ncbi:hypothetical protein SAY86_026277 [Trapa natans]|uniref:Glycolipid transfer protein domain-containing protein n=1 Tax=Trapa natans TaxID=22666 RepID=A0AAN7KLG1_TRANT|nr:hypothetical protein SAY86_026277 [Trapa natans]
MSAQLYGKGRKDSIDKAEEMAQGTMEVDLERQLRDTIKNASKTSATLPLSGVVDAFEGLATFLQSNRSQELRLDTFCDACSLVSVLFGCLGLAFKFAEMEYVTKVHDLMEASRRYATLHNILDLDIANGSVKTQGSHSRNLRRVRQGLDLIRALFMQFIVSKYALFLPHPHIHYICTCLLPTRQGQSHLRVYYCMLICISDYSLKNAATTAYSQVCAPYHTWAVRTAVYAGMYTLPSRDQLLLKLGETGN